MLKFPSNTGARLCLPVVRPTIEVTGKWYILYNRKVPTLQLIPTKICIGHYANQINNFAKFSEDRIIGVFAKRV